MAVQTLLSRANRTGRVNSAGQVIPNGSTGRIRVLSDIAAADLADPTKWVRMVLDVQDNAGVWLYDAIPGQTWNGAAINDLHNIFAGATFQLGPVKNKDGTTNAAGANRGFQFDAAEVAGRTVRGILVLKAGDPNAVPEPADATVRIGVTYEVLP